MTDSAPTALPPRVLGVRDLTLFYFLACFSIRWVASAAAAGPSSLVLWVLGCLTFFLPLGCAVVDLAGRFPEEGGMYVWASRAFGERAGFLTGWMYWASNLTYFPSLLYFAAGNLLVLGGTRGAALSASPVFFVTAACVGLALAVIPNVLGLRIGRWLHNGGAIGVWIPAAVLIGAGAWILARDGSATEFSLRTLAPGRHLADLALFASIAFAFVGLESASLMGAEIRAPRRTLPRALLLASALVVVVYLAATAAILVAVPASQVSGLAGITQAVARVAASVGAAWLGPVCGACITLGAVAAVGAYFAATARLPFVAGAARMVPARFARLHPRFGTPVFALLTQAGLSALLIVLGQAGTTVRGAYDVLVSMTLVATFAPFLVIFAAYVAVQRRPRPAGALRMPGGVATAYVAGALGFGSSALGLMLAMVPSASEPHKALAVTKVLGLGVVLVVLGLVPRRTR